MEHKHVYQGSQDCRLLASSTGLLRYDNKKSFTASISLDCFYSVVQSAPALNAMMSDGFLSGGFTDLNQLAMRLRDEYAAALPFPHCVIDNLFDSELIKELECSSPELSRNDSSEKHGDGKTVQSKYATPRGDRLQPEKCKNFTRFLNSSEFLDFLQILTSIEEPLIPDPHFCGGGLHQIKANGFLKVHADFHSHPETNLARRINLLLYLNSEWDDSYGGFLELWSPDMKSHRKKIRPISNRMVIFSTNDFTYHGVPDPVRCPSTRARKSIALYYYSNGRPLSELRPEHLPSSSLWQERPGERFQSDGRFKSIIRGLTPPFLMEAYKAVVSRSKPQNG